MLLTPALEGDARMRVPYQTLVALQGAGSALLPDGPCRLVHYELHKGSKARGGSPSERPLVGIVAGSLDAAGAWAPDALGRCLLLSSDAVSSVSFDADQSALVFDVMTPGANTAITLRRWGAGFGGSDPGAVNPASPAAADTERAWQEAARSIAVRYQAFWDYEVRASEGAAPAESDGDADAGGAGGDAAAEDADQIARLARRKEVLEVAESISRMLTFVNSTRQTRSGLSRKEHKRRVLEAHLQALVSQVETQVAAAAAAEKAKAAALGSDAGGAGASGSDGGAGAASSVGGEGGAPVSATGAGMPLALGQTLFVPTPAAAGGKGDDAPPAQQQTQQQPQVAVPHSPLPAAGGGAAPALQIKKPAPASASHSATHSAHASPIAVLQRGNSGNSAVQPQLQPSQPAPYAAQQALPPPQQPGSARGGYPQGYGAPQAPEQYEGAPQHQLPLPQQQPFPGGALPAQQAAWLAAQQQQQQQQRAAAAAAAAAMMYAQQQQQQQQQRIAGGGDSYYDYELTSADGGSVADASEYGGEWAGGGGGAMGRRPRPMAQPADAAAAAMAAAAAAYYHQQQSHQQAVAAQQHQQHQQQQQWSPAMAAAAAAAESAYYQQQQHQQAMSGGESLYRSGPAPALPLRSGRGGGFRGATRGGGRLGGGMGRTGAGYGGNPAGIYAGGDGSA